MCIRDSYIPPSLQPVPLTPEEQEELRKKEERKDRPVSYTHLTIFQFVLLRPFDLTIGQAALILVALSFAGAALVLSLIHI